VSAIVRGRDRSRRRRIITSSDRLDPLGLKALAETYAAPSRSDVVRSRRDLPADVIVDRLRDRLRVEGAAESLRILAGLSRPELDLLVALEREDLARP
jgi:hypothetical protein